MPHNKTNPSAVRLCGSRVVIHVLIQFLRGKQTKTRHIHEERIVQTRLFRGTFCLSVNQMEPESESADSGSIPFLVQVFYLFARNGKSSVCVNHLQHFNLSHFSFLQAMKM